MVTVRARGDVFGLTGTVLGGRFRVDEQIAEGGFAVVYRAYQQALDRKVALKVLRAPPAYDEAGQAAFCERFAEEARTLARLKHPGIVDLYEFSSSAMPSGVLAPWMALEWVEGETLQAWLARRRGEGAAGMTPGEALELLRPALQALAFAHRRGIAHRDVKPANLMLAQLVRGRSVRVLDFGIAKVMHGEDDAGTGHTRTGSVPAFSPAYAAPEQVTFSRTGPWTDVHALGLILTELLTARAPYGDEAAFVHEQVMAPTRPTPRAKGCDAGPFEAVIAKALALSPAERWKDAGELLDALERASGGADRTIPVAPSAAPLVAPPQSPHQRRRRVALAIGLAVPMGAALLYAGGKWRTASSRERAPAAVAAQPAMAAMAATAKATAKATTISPTATPTATATPTPTPTPTTAAPRPAHRVSSRPHVDPPRAVGGTGGKDLFDDIK